MAATMKDIAKQTGLGLATISSYFNGGNVRETNRVKIEAAIQDLHFEVNEMARGLKTNRTKSIGVIIPELNSIFCAEIITEVEDVLRAHGYATIICDCRTNQKLEEQAVEFLFRRKVDGIINMPVSNRGNHLTPFIDTHKPIVLIDRKINGIDCDCVLVDNLMAVKNAIGRLIARGHKKIGMIAGPDHIFTAKERVMGYQLAMMEAGLPVEERLMIHSDYTIMGGVTCLEELVHKNSDMTAVFVSNYEMSMGAMIGINELGIEVPGQLAFIGFDNAEFARACVPMLSIVTQPTKEIGEKVAGLMLKRLDHYDGTGEIIKLQTGFIDGKSI